LTVGPWASAAKRGLEGVAPRFPSLKERGDCLAHEALESRVFNASELCLDLRQLHFRAPS